MAATLRGLLLIVLYALVGVACFTLQSTLWLLIDLFFAFFSDGSLHSARLLWYDSDLAYWVRVCALVVLACLLAAGAVRLRFFAITVGTVMCVLAPLANVLMFVMFSLTPETTISEWPVWGFDASPLFIGSILITLHFLVPIRPEQAPPVSTEEEDAAGDEQSDEGSEVAYERE